MGACLSNDDAATSKQSFILQTLSDHEAGINCMSLSEDKSILVTGSEDRTARLVLDLHVLDCSIAYCIIYVILPRIHIIVELSDYCSDL